MLPAARLCPSNSVHRGWCVWADASALTLSPVAVFCVTVQQLITSWASAHDACGVFSSHWASAGVCCVRMSTAREKCVRVSFCSSVCVCASLLLLFSVCVGICRVCTSVSAASAEACSLPCPCDGTNKVRLCDRSAACLRMRCVHNTRVLCCVLSRVSVSCVLLSLWLLHLLCVK